MPNATENRVLTLHALTFMHPGTGQTTGVVDLPVQREVHSGFPMIASSGLKGSLRDKAERQWGKNAKVNTIFGSEDPKLSGALGVTDARILAFPVRSLQQVFVWVTCPMVLKRLKRDLDLAGVTLSNVNLAGAAGHAINDGQAFVPGNTLTNPLLLEELRFTVTNNDAHAESAAKAIAALTSSGAGFDSSRLALISNDDFTYLVKNATQVSARIALNERKTTTGGEGNLWYEETLPPETILYALIFSNKPRRVESDKESSGGRAESGGGGQGNGAEIKDAAGVAKAVSDLFPEGDPYLQVGGNETVGQGWCCTRIVGG